MLIFMFMFVWDESCCIEFEKGRGGSGGLSTDEGLEVGVDWRDAGVEYLVRCFRCCCCCCECGRG